MPKVPVCVMFEVDTHSREDAEVREERKLSNANLHDVAGCSEAIRSASTA